MKFRLFSLYTQLVLFLLLISQYNLINGLNISDTKQITISSLDTQIAINITDLPTPSYDATKFKIEANGVVMNVMTTPILVNTGILSTTITLPTPIKSYYNLIAVYDDGTIPTTRSNTSYMYITPIVTGSQHVKVNNYFQFNVTGIALDSVDMFDIGGIFVHKNTFQQQNSTSIQFVTSSLNQPTNSTFINAPLIAYSGGLKSPPSLLVNLNPIITSINHVGGETTVTVIGKGFTPSASVMYFNESTSTAIPFTYVNQQTIFITINSSTPNSMLKIVTSFGSTTFPFLLTPYIRFVTRTSVNYEQVCTIQGSNINTDINSNIQASAGNYSLSICQNVSPTELVCRLPAYAPPYFIQPLKLSIDGVLANPFTYNSYIYTNTSQNVLGFTQYDNRTTFVYFYLPIEATIPPEANIQFIYNGILTPIELYNNGFKFNQTQSIQQSNSYKFVFFGIVYNGINMGMPHITSISNVVAGLGDRVTITGYYLTYVTMVKTLNVFSANIIVLNDTMITWVPTITTNQIVYLQGNVQSNVVNMEFLPDITLVSHIGNVLYINGTNIQYDDIVSYVYINGVNQSVSLIRYTSLFLFYINDTLSTGSTISVSSNGLMSTTVPIILQPSITSVFSNTPGVITISGKWLSLTGPNGNPLSNSILFGGSDCSSPYNPVGFEATMIICGSTTTSGTVTVIINGSLSNVASYVGNNVSIISYTQMQDKLVIKVANIVANLPDITFMLGSFTINSATLTGSNTYTINLPLTVPSGVRLSALYQGIQSTSVFVTLKPIIDTNSIRSFPFLSSQLTITGKYFTPNNSAVISDGIQTQTTFANATMLVYYSNKKNPQTRDTTKTTLLYVSNSNNVLSDPLLLYVKPLISSTTTNIRWIDPTTPYYEIWITGYNFYTPNTVLNVGPLYYYDQINLTRVSNAYLDGYQFNLPVTSSDRILNISNNIGVASMQPAMPAALSYLSRVPLSGGSLTMRGAGFVNPLGTLTLYTPISNNNIQAINTTVSFANMFDASISNRSQSSFSVSCGPFISNILLFAYEDPKITSISQPSPSTLQIMGSLVAPGYDRVRVRLPSNQLLANCNVQSASSVLCLYNPEEVEMVNGAITLIRNGVFTGSAIITLQPNVLGSTMYNYNTTSIKLIGSALNGYYGSNIIITNTANNDICVLVLPQQQTSNTIECNLPRILSIEPINLSLTIGSYPTIYYTVYSAPPSISEATGIIYQTTDTVTIKGLNFYSTNVSVTIGDVGCISTTYISSTEIRCLFNGTAKPVDEKTALNVQVDINNGEAIANSQVFLYDYVVNTCNPGSIQCNNNGQCINGACFCNSNYTGLLCQTLVNQTNSDTPIIPSNPSQGVFRSSDLSIQFTHIRRLDINGNVLETIPISPIQWNQTGNLLTSNSNTSYYTGLIDTRLKLNLQVIIFNDSTTITFGGERIQMDKNSLKFQIEIVSFGFLQQLQTMEMVYALFKPSIESECQSTQTEFNDGDDLRWLINTFGDSKLISKFNQRVNVDNRVIISNSKVLTNNGQDSNNIYKQSFYQSGQYIAVAQSIPSFSSNAIVDPSISLLLGVDNSNQDGCGETKKKNLLWVIAVAVGGAAVITAGIVLLVKYNTLKIKMLKLNIKSKMDGIKMK